jgi:hypothetical protein
MGADLIRQCPEGRVPAFTGLPSLPQQTSSADLLGYKAHEAAGEDRNEGDLDESDEAPLCPFEDGVQPAVATASGQGALNPNTLRNQGSAVTAGAGLDGDAERFASLGQPLAAIAEITQSCSFKAVAGKMRDRQRNGSQAAIAISEPGLALKNCPKPEPSLPLRTRPIWLWLPDPIPLMVPP